MSTTDYQVLIAGGGLVGASLAVALGQAGVRTAVVEAAAFASGGQPGYDDRSLALAQGSQRIFEGLGVWEALAPQTCPIETIHVSDRGRFGFTRLRHDEEGVPALGYVVTARVLGQVLVERLAELDAVDILAPAQLRDLELGDQGARVRLEQAEGARSVGARLLVAADGAHSTIRDRLGIETLRRDYGQTAIVANLTPQLPHRNVAYERFTDTGPMALLPMTEGRCALVWTVPDSQADEVVLLDDAAFLARVQERFGYRLGRLLKVGRRHAYPLQLVRARESVRPRLALIGNAMHTLHPIAGQGFNLGLRDVAALAEVVVDAGQAGQDCGDPAVLGRYAEWRRRDQQRVMFFTDSLVRLFAQPLAPVALARDAGMLAMDLCPPAKRWFGRLTMGRAGRLPRLARGLPLT